MVPTLSPGLQELARRVPGDFELLAQRKGFKRYMCPALRAAVQERQAAVAAREACLSGSLQARPPLARLSLCPRPAPSACGIQALHGALLYCSGNEARNRSTLKPENQEPDPPLSFNAEFGPKRT